MTTERIEWCNAAELQGVQVLAVDNCARRWSMFHETYSVCTGLSIARAAEWSYRGKHYLQPADGLSLMEPGEVHANTRITDPASFRVLLIDPALMARFSAELGARLARPHLKVAQLHGGPLYQMFVALHRSLEAGHATPLERQTRFAACMRSMLEQCAEAFPAPRAGRERPAVQRAKEYIDAHYGEPISLDQLVVAGGGLSRFHLVRAFAREYGLPPHAYQLQRRLAEARRLLARGERSSHVAAALGFADQSHFTRHFRAANGTTPRAYAAAVSV